MFLKFSLVGCIMFLLMTACYVLVLTSFLPSESIIATKDVFYPSATSEYPSML